jgi:hypothetical protein
MSFDHALVVRSRKRSFTAVRAVAAAALKAHDGARLARQEGEDGPEDEEMEIHVMFASPRSGGPIFVRRLPRGFQLTIDSTSGGTRACFAALGEVMKDIARGLGTVVEGAEAEKLLDEADAAASSSPLASAAVIALLDGEGRVLEEGETDTERFVADLLPGGMLKPAAGSHRLLSEDARLDLRGARLLVTLHTAKGKPFRRYDYALDGYGRIRSFSAADL